MIIPLQKKSTETDDENKEMISGQKENYQSRVLNLHHRINDHYSKKTTETGNLIMIINWIGPQNDTNYLATKREPAEAVKLISTIVLTKTQQKHIFSLRQSTETGLKQPKWSRDKRYLSKSWDSFLNHSVDNKSSSNRNKTRNFITTINQNQPNNLVTSDTCQIHGNRNK